MKHLDQTLIQETAFEERLMGSHALVRAMVESGTRVVASYPGAPTPEIATVIEAFPKDECPFSFEFSINEKVATKVALGAALNGNLSCAFYRSAGLNMALDTFVQLGLLNIPGGMVVILGDDPGGDSSQNEQDNRNIYRMARVAVFEPASPREAYQYYKHAATLAAVHETFVVFRMTTRVCHTTQKIAADQYTPSIDYKTGFSPENGPSIPLTAPAIEMKQHTMAKFQRIKKDLRKMDLSIVAEGEGGLGIITSGLTYLSVMDVLEQAEKRPSILKLGATNPLDADAVVAFLSGHDQILILEELDDILETQIKALAYDLRLRVKIIGKVCDEDFIGEFTPDKTRAKLASAWPHLLPEFADDHVGMPDRPAQMCPGCGHRSAFMAVEKALTANDVTVADIGCYTLGYMPPYEMGEVLTGAFPGITAGLSLHNDQKDVVAFIGDSTFFHAGLPGLINTALNNRDMTLIIMENKTTAMTGRKDHAGDKIPIQDLLKGLKIDQVFACETYSRKKLTELVKIAMASRGISVVIARHV